MMQKKWDPRIPSSDSFLLMELKYESMQHDWRDLGGKITFHLQDAINVEQWFSFLCGKLIDG